MKILSGSLRLIFLLLLFAGCSGKGTVKNDQQSMNDTVTVADTGYTGIKQYMSGQNMVKEVTFKNGVREGLMKSFYQDGQFATDILVREWTKGRFSKMVLPGGPTLPFNSL